MTISYLTEVKNVKSGSTLSKYTLTLDPAGNPTRVDSLGTAGEAYKYDAADRLTEVCHKASGVACTKNNDPYVRFTYDNVGNRLTEKRSNNPTTTYIYDYADELVVRGATVFTYDRNGQETAAGTRTFTWNVANQVASSTQAGSTIEVVRDLVEL